MPKIGFKQGWFFSKITDFSKNFQNFQKIFFAPNIKMMGQMKVGKFGSGSIFCITDRELEFENFFKSIFFGNIRLFQKSKPFSWTNTLDFGVENVPQ